MTNPPKSPHHSHHVTQFHFHSTMNFPNIIATDTMEFSEEIRPQESQTQDTVQEKAYISKKKTAQEKQATSEQNLSDNSSSSLKRKDTHDNTQHGRDIPNGMQTVGGIPSGTQAIGGISDDTQAAKDDWDEYRCLIVEEPPPANDT